MTYGISILAVQCARLIKGYYTQGSPQCALTEWYIVGIVIIKLNVQE